MAEAVFENKVIPNAPPWLDKADRKAIQKGISLGPYGVIIQAGKNMNERSGLQEFGQ
jgi:hypothetical protein